MMIFTAPLLGAEHGRDIVEKMTSRFHVMTLAKSLSDSSNFTGRTGGEVEQSTRRDDQV